VLAVQLLVPKLGIDRLIDLDRLCVEEGGGGFSMTWSQSKEQVVSAKWAIHQRTSAN
jgi:hypothetical protein